MVKKTKTENEIQDHLLKDRDPGDSFNVRRQGAEGGQEMTNR